MRTTAHIHAEADAAAYEGNFRLALALVMDVLRRVPDDHRARLKVGLCLAALGKAREGASIALMVARRLGQRGWVMAAIGACRDALHLDPTHPGVQSMLENIHELLGGGQRGGPPAVFEPITPVVVDDDDTAIQPDTPDLIERARAMAMAESDSGYLPKDRICAFVPFFSDLGRDAFVAVVRRMNFVKLGARTFVVQQGQPGSSMFIIASGEVEVTIRDDLGRVQVVATLGPGDLFGEMSLLTERVRAASVETKRPVELFEINRAALEGVARRHPSVLEDIVNFAKSRMIQNLLSSSSIFGTLEEEERADVVQAFDTRFVKANEVVIPFGTPPQGLYLVLEGELEVSTPDESGEYVILGYLSPGEVAGEISLLDDSETTAKVIASERSVVLHLPKTQFSEIAEKYPRLRSYLQELSADRMAGIEAASTTRDVVDADDMVLI